MTAPVGTPRVSVCLPTYQGAEFVVAAVESVLAQTLGDLELLVVDDASTDGTLDLLGRIADPRLRIERNEGRLGLAGNFNRCLQLARAELVTIFGQDDVMLSGNLEAKARLLEGDDGLALVHSAAELLLEKGATPPGKWMEDAAQDFVADGADYLRRLVLEGNRICAPSVMVRRRQLLSVGGFDEDLSYACDFGAWLKLCSEGRIAFLSQALVRYRWHARNVTHGFSGAGGIDEVLLACRRGVAHHALRSGRSGEGQILEQALEQIFAMRRREAELESGKAWLEAQLSSAGEQQQKAIEHWRADAGRWQGEAEKLQKLGEEQRAWVAKLEAAKAWLEEQLVNWQREAAVQRELNTAKESWIGQLTEARDFHAGQSERLKEQLAQALQPPLGKQ